MALTRTVGIGLDGTVTSITFGGTVIPTTKGSYGDSLDPQKLSYMGSQGQDEKTLGGYKTDDAKFSMSAVVFRTLFVPALAKVGGGNVQFAITANRVHPQLGDDSDLLTGCTVKAMPQSVEAGGKPEEVEVTIDFLQLAYTDARVLINRPAGTEQGAATL